MSRSKSCAAAAILFLGLVTTASADPEVTVGTHVVNAGEAVVAIPLYVRNNPSYGPNNTAQGFSFRQIFATDVGGDPIGGPTFVLGTPGQGFPMNTGYVGPASGPNTGVDILTGTVFNVPSHTIPNDGGVSTSTAVSIGMNFPGSAVIPDSDTLLATMYISTVGVAPGTRWALNIGGGDYVEFDTGSELIYIHTGGNFNDGPIGPHFPNAVPYQGPLNFADTRAYSTYLTDGWIEVVPEPSSIVLGLLAAVGLAMVVRRRRLSSQ